MKKSFLFMAMAVLMLVSCTQQIIEEEEPEQPAEQTDPEEPAVETPGNYIFTLNASAGDADTKTSYAEDRYFSWSSGDQISVLFHKEAENRFFTLTTTGTGASATFSGEIEAGFEVGASDDPSKKYALFPAGAHSYTPGNYPVFNIPAETDFTASHFSANIPMAANGDGENNYAFTHMAGVYKVVFTGIHSSVSKVRLAVTNQSNYQLSGNFNLTTCYDSQHLFRWTEVYDGVISKRSLVYIANVVSNTATFYIPYSHDTNTQAPTSKSNFLPTFVLTNPDNYNTLISVSAKNKTAFIGASDERKSNYNRMVVLPNIPVPAPGTGTAPVWPTNHHINWENVTTEIAGLTTAKYAGINSMKVTADEANLYILVDAKASFMLDNASYDNSNLATLYIGDGTDTGTSFADWWWPSKKYQTTVTGWLKTANAFTYTADSGTIVDYIAKVSGEHCYFEITYPRYSIPALQNTSAYIGFTFNKRYMIGTTKYKDPTVDESMNTGNDAAGYAPPTGGSASMYQITLPAYVASSSTATSPVNLTFTEAAGEVMNPERGLYNQTSFYFNGESLPSLSISGSHEEPLEMVLFYLTGYKSKDLDDAVLNAIRTVFSNLRAAGKKAIVRFGYSSDHGEEDKPWDASKAQIIKHIQQLKPIFTANEDIIYVVQTGFIGTYGEWYYTGSNYPAVNGTDDFYYEVSGSEVLYYANHKAVVDEILDAVPDSRQIALRAPYYKRYYLNPTSITTWDAISSWDGTDANSRIGFFNDGFLANNGNDTGTFKDDVDRAMWNGQSAKLVVGGETAYQNEDPNPLYCGHDVAISRIADGHVSYLNKNTGNKIMKYWIDNGYLTDICKALGYRLVVNSADLTFSSLSSGSTVNYSISIQNKGKMTVIYPRPFKLVLVHDGTPTVLADFGDVRNLAPGAAASTFSGSFVLPQNVMQYDQLAIWLPDNAAGLRSNAAYSIRLANSDVTWSGGYNVLYTF